MCRVLSGTIIQRPEQKRAQDTKIQKALSNTKKTNGPQTYGTPPYSYWIQSYQRKTKDAAETASFLRNFLPPFRKPGRIDADNSRGGLSERVRTCSGLTENQNTLHRSETNGIADRCVRRIFRRNSNSDGSTWSSRRVVELCDRMLLPPAERGGQTGRWQDSIREHI